MINNNFIKANSRKENFTMSNINANNTKDNFYMLVGNTVDNRPIYNLDIYHDRKSADEFFETYDTGLTREAHEVLLNLCTFRNILMLNCEDLFIENTKFHAYFNRCIENDLFNECLVESGLPPLSLKKFKGKYFTRGDFKDGNTTTYFCIRSNKNKSIEFDEAYEFTMSIVAEMLYMIQDYLYHIDCEYETDYMAFNILKLKAAEKLFFDDIIEIHSINNEKETK